MKRWSCLAAMVSACPAYAQLIENFDYPNGPLTQVSGGLWEIWRPTAPDFVVANGQLKDQSPRPGDHPADVIRRFDPVLTSYGQRALFQFDIRMDYPQLGSGTDLVGFAISPASPPYVNGAQNYSQSLYLQVMRSVIPGQSEIWVYFTSSSSYQNINLGTFSNSVFHSIRGEFFREAPFRMQFQVFVDGQLELANTLRMDDPRGYNAVEFWAFPHNGESIATIDNLKVLAVPEVGTLATLGLGALALVRRRKRR